MDVADANGIGKFALRRFGGMRQTSEEIVERCKVTLAKLLLLGSVLGVATTCSEQRESVQIRFQSTWEADPDNLQQRQWHAAVEYNL